MGLSEKMLARAYTDSGLPKFQAVLKDFKSCEGRDEKYIITLPYAVVMKGEGLDAGEILTLKEGESFRMVQYFNLREQRAVGNAGRQVVDKCGDTHEAKQWELWRENVEYIRLDRVFIGVAPNE